MKKLVILFLVVPFFSFMVTADTNVFFGDSVTFGNELQSEQYTQRWSTQYCNESQTNEINQAGSGAAMTPGLNAGRPVFDVNQVPFYQSSFEHIFVSYWINDFLYNGTPAAYAVATSNAVDGILARGWPASKIVLCFNYLPDSYPVYPGMTHAIALRWLAALKGVQQAKGTSFLDFYTPIYNRPDNATYSNDYIHPTAAWNTIMTQYAETNIVGPSTPLPAKLINFAGQRQGNNNNLKWTVAQEQDVESYEIERSEDGRTWKKAGTIKSLGNSAIQRTYSFIDNAVSGVKQFYRLITVDINGTSNQSNIIILNGAKTNILKLGSLFPNPADSRINLVVDLPSKATVIIDVMDVIGRVVKTQKNSLESGSNTVELNVEELTKGSYFVRVASENDEFSPVINFIKK
ncbi:MAG: SGNH/GDSL hydrolase family protein [Bacteroidota bacterium]|nr:SGNH/GDSL hydrolase family protein [Bacteroidota bacterium]